MLGARGLTGPASLDGEIVIGVCLLGLWSSFALTTRRLRDIGIEPAMIVPLYAALWVVNAVLLQPMSQLDPHDFRLAEAAWAASQWLAAVPLLVWPPAKPHDVAPVERVPAVAELNWRD